MQSRHFNRKQYFDEQRHTCQHYYIPYLKQCCPENPQHSVLEIGCGEGGNLAAFAQAGSQVTGIELLPQRAEEARTFFEEDGLKGTFITANIFDVNRSDFKFDIVMLHDVIEHIADKARLLQHLTNFLKPGGVLFIAFPAWQMPFGGHQQMCHSPWLSRFPFIHLLPRKLYQFVLEMAGEPAGCISEMLSIKQTRMTIETFERLTRPNYTILHRTLWFINPHYEQKFSLRPRKLCPFIAAIPYLHGFCCTSAWYLLKI